MEEKYSVEEILKEAKHLSGEHTAKDISAKADMHAQRILESLKTNKSSDEIDKEFDFLLSELAEKTAAKPVQVQPPKPIAPPQEAQREKPQPKVVPVAPPKGESEITIAPEVSNVPQRKKRMKSIDDVMDDIAPAQGNKIEEALKNQKDEHETDAHKKLTHTGVIRKANALIDDSPQPVAPHRMGTIQKHEKIVGEKEDIQTKVYNAYIKNKEKKKQDTGIIKTIDIRVMPKSGEEGDDGKTKVISARNTQANAGLIDEETDIEKTIVGAKSQRIISNFHHTGNIEGQTRLEGFFDDEEYEKITEEELEEQLELNRREKIDSFELAEAFKAKNSDAVESVFRRSIDDTYAPEKETPVIHDVIDYNSINDQRAVYLELESLLNRFKLRTVLTFAAEIAVAIIGIFGSGVLGNFGLATGGERIYIILNTVLLLFIMAANGRAVWKGLKALITLKPSADSLPAFAACITLVHCLMALTLGENGAGVSHLYVGATGFVFLLNCLGKRSMTRRIFKNFRFIIKGGEKYSCACITDEKEIKEFSKGTEREDMDIRYNAKTEFPTRFLANSFADDPADSIAKISVYPAIGLSLVAALITYLITKDVMAAVSAATAIMLMGIPASALMAFNKALENTDVTLLKERGTISGFAAIHDAANTTAVVLSSEELFPTGCCTLKGMKLFKKMQMDEAILYAASVLSETRHPFKDVFMESVSEVKNHMPVSYDTAYESKLGLSTWIYDRKVLLGNKEMMTAHGIEIPTTANPETYIKNNTRVMFLAIDGSVYAMFVVEYFSDSVIEYELQRLEASGVEVLVKTEDSNIDEALLSEVFDLESTSVKVLGMRAGELYREKLQHSVYNEAKIINRGDPVTFIRSITACSILNSQFGLLKLLEYISIILGSVIVTIFALLGSISSIGPVHLIVYAAFWMVVTNLIPRIYKAAPKR